MRVFLSYERKIILGGWRSKEKSPCCCGAFCFAHTVFFIVCRGVWQWYINFIKTVIFCIWKIISINNGGQTQRRQEFFFSLRFHCVSLLASIIFWFRIFHGNINEVHNLLLVNHTRKHGMEKLNWTSFQIMLWKKDFLGESSQKNILCSNRYSWEFHKTWTFL